MLSLQTTQVSASAAELVTVLESQHHDQAERSQQDQGKSTYGRGGGGSRYTTTILYATADDFQ